MSAGGDLIGHGGVDEFVGQTSVLLLFVLEVPLAKGGHTQAGSLSGEGGEIVLHGEAVGGGLERGLHARREISSLGPGGNSGSKVAPISLWVGTLAKAFGRS